MTTIYTKGQVSVLACQCCDPYCPACKGKCREQVAEGIAYRIDMDDQDGTPMCADCLADAAECDLFRIEEF